MIRTRSTLSKKPSCLRELFSDTRPAMATAINMPGRQTHPHFAHAFRSRMPQRANPSLLCPRIPLTHAAEGVPTLMPQNPSPLCMSIPFTGAADPCRLLVTNSGEHDRDPHSEIALRGLIPRNHLVDPFRNRAPRSHFALQGRAAMPHYEHPWQGPIAGDLLRRTIAQFRCKDFGGCPVS